MAGSDSCWASQSRPDRLTITGGRVLIVRLLTAPYHHTSLGGDESTFAGCARPVYESIAKQWFLVGPGSSDVRLKLVVNLLLGA